MTSFKDFMQTEAGVMPNMGQPANQAQQANYTPPQWQKLQVNYAPGQRQLQVVRPTGGIFNLPLTPQQMQAFGQNFQPQATPGQPTAPVQPAAR